MVATAPRRTAILDAALACFLVKSVSATTVEDIRQRSGASIGSIYHFFGSKDGLAALLYVDTLADHHDAYLTALTTSPSARAGITGSVAAHLQWVAANRDRARYLFNWRELEVIDRRDEALADLNESFYTAANHWLEGHVRAGHIRALTPRMFQSLWMGPTLEYARLWMARPTSGAELLTAQNALADAAWDAVRQPRRPLQTKRRSA